MQGNSMKKIIVIVFLALSSSLFLPQFCGAQYVRPDMDSSSAGKPLPPKTFEDNLSLGGSFGLQFGDITFIELEPLLNYHVGEKFMVGIGPIYQYLKVEDPYFGNYTSSTYGARIAAMYFLPEELSKIFIMGEYDVLNVPEPSLYSYQIERGYLTFPLLGIGYKEEVTDRTFFYVYGLWNFNNSIYNPFSNPIINVGVDVGLGR